MVIIYCWGSEEQKKLLTFIFYLLKICTLACIENLYMYMYMYNVHV